MRPIIQYTTGLPGCGKTYVRCARFVPDFLLNNDGLFISNYPWNKQVIAEYCAKIEKGRCTGFLKRLFSSNNSKPRTVDDFLERMVSIPEDVLRSWQRLESGPWAWLETQNLENAHVAIDEIHNYCPSDLWMRSKDLHQQWQNFLGEVRHQGLTIEFISQCPTKVSSTIEKHAAIRTSIISCESDRDPFFKIQNHYWYNLIAKITGSYIPAAIEIEKRQIDKKWVESFRKKFRFDTFYYKFYNSFSKPISGTGSGLSEKKEPYQRYTRLGLLWWFFRDNAGSVVSRLFYTIIGLWLCFFGGMPFLLSQILNIGTYIGKQKVQSFSKSGTSAKIKSAEQSKSVKTAVAAPVQAKSPRTYPKNLKSMIMQPKCTIDKKLRK